MAQDQQELAASDPILAQIIASIPEPRTDSTGNVFFDLMSCVIEQQIHYRSTKRIFAKMLEKANLTTLTPHNFEEFAQKGFADAKLSVGKLETIERVLDFFTHHNPDWTALSDAEVTEQLASIKGIGQWTIDMILLFTLDRKNVFPADDFHLKNGMVSLYGLDPNVKLKKQMLDIAATWGAHRSLAVRYLLEWKKHRKTAL
jgi:DNA-3-methyladenine glycosylase II